MAPDSRDHEGATVYSTSSTPTTATLGDVRALLEQVLHLLREDVLAAGHDLSSSRAVEDCQINGGSGLALVSCQSELIRPLKVIANALSAGFHLIAHRALPRPVGSRDRVTR